MPACPSPPAGCRALSERAPIPTRADFRLFRPMPTRWMDNDVYGHVNNVVYYSYFDTAVNGFLIDATGSLLFGAGFSSSEKLILTGSISQNNLFGSGNALTLNANTSKVNRNIGLSYNNPYYTVDGISRGFNIYQRNVDPTSLSIGQYKSSSLGGGVSYGFPIGDDDSISVGLSYDRTSIDILDDSPQRYKDFVEKFGDSNTTLLASAGWATYDLNWATTSR
jgi:outer membrane protein assembly factor BamA